MSKKAILAVALLALASTSAAAQVSSGIGYFHFDEELLGENIDLGAVVGSIGYDFEINQSFTITPELRGGVGVVDESVGEGKVELDSLFGLALRLQFNLSDLAYLHLSPSFARYKFSASGPGGSLSESDEEFAVGGGIGFRFTPNLASEIGYENVDGTNVYTAGLRFAF